MATGREPSENLLTAYEGKRAIFTTSVAGMSRVKTLEKESPSDYV